MIEYARYKDIPGILVALDFEKAVDLLNLNFLFRVLPSTWSFFYSVDMGLI